MSLGHLTSMEIDQITGRIYSLVIHCRCVCTKDGCFINTYEVSTYLHVDKEVLHISENKQSTYTVP